MRHRYLITYDICDPKRLRLVYKVMLGWGDHLQLSVFECDLSPRELIELRSSLSDILHFDEDQVLFAKLDPARDSDSRTIVSIGRAYADRERVAVIV